MWETLFFSPSRGLFFLEVGSEAVTKISAPQICVPLVV